jgi:16S rRNA (guanine527-N7)-methyltransferase
MTIQLIQGAKDLGIELGETQVNIFNEYLSEIKKWNESINLTSIKDDQEFLIKHFLDSISVSQYFAFNNQQVLDMGTGGGFPGLPLKIVFSQINITFLDSSNKKMKVLDSICNQLKIDGYTVLCDNIEKAGQNPIYREKFDIVLCRALSSLNVLIEYGIPFLKERGKLIVYKGPNIQEEVDNSLRALSELKAEISEKHTITLPFSDYERNILVVEKIGKTDGKYPRKVGIPRKRPL